MEPSDVSQPESDRVEVGAAVGGRKSLGIGAHPLDARQDSQIESAGPPEGQHLLAGIVDNDLSRGGPAERSKVRQGTQRNISGATGDIEQYLAGTRVQPGEHLGLPP